MDLIYYHLLRPALLCPAKEESPSPMAREGDSSLLFYKEPFYGVVVVRIFPEAPTAIK